MDGDIATLYVLEDALVGCGLTADVVMLGQTVYRDGHTQTRDLHPLNGDRNHGTGNHHRKYAQFAKGGKHAAQLAMPDQRLAAYQGNLERLVLANESQDTFDQGVTTQVVQVAEGDFAAQMCFSIGIAPRATERALTRDLDGQHGDAAAQDPAPPGEQLARGQSRFRRRNHSKM
jgi:hypothetical protein